MAQDQWEADKMLDVYIYDYLLKRKMHNSAEAFMTEGKVAPGPVAIDAPGGFLFEWWCVFWDIFIARTNEEHSEPAAAYNETQQKKAREKQQLQMQQLQLIQQRNAQLLDPNRIALLKSSPNHQGHLVQSNSANMAPLQQMQSRVPLTADNRGEVNIGAPPKSLHTDPSSIYGQAILQSKSGLGLNQGVTSLPLKGWPLTGIDQPRTTLGVQLQRPNMLIQNQLLMESQQQALAQTRAQSNIGNSPNYTDPGRLSGIPRASVSVKDVQSKRIEGSVCSSGQPVSPKIKMPPSQQQEQLQQQKTQQSNRKRKQHSSSGPAYSNSTGNTVGSPQSGNGMNAVVAKSLMIYNPEGAETLASPSNMLDDLDRYGDVGSLEDNVESLLSNYGVDGAEPHGTLKQSPVKVLKESPKRFNFSEAGCIRTRNSKVTCCHFSSDGKFLASAGHDNKVVLWNMDTLQTESTPEEHRSVITDVRFRPNSTQLATTSIDHSVRLWDAANPGYSVQAYTGHNSAVMSLDFHPKKTELFCFCDQENEIHYWNINSFSRIRLSKGGNTQVRFQPGAGNLLAAASDKAITIFDVETDKQIHTFQGHSEMVNYICWEANGDYLASVSATSVKVWSLAARECIQELSPSGNQFHSCVFHPSFPTLLVIGGTSSLELWNMGENKRMTVNAHKNIISALAQSPHTGMVASSSHDCSVKLWS